jgi:nitrogen regulatory protein PII-like uncharacterized protein
MRIILDIYWWIKGDGTYILNCKKQYLSKLCLKNDGNSLISAVYGTIQKNKRSTKKKTYEFVKIWDSIWQIKEMDRYEEEAYFKIFIEKIGQAINATSAVKDIEDVFDVFVKTLNARKYLHIFAVNDEAHYLLAKILEVHLESWRKSKNEQLPSRENWCAIHENAHKAIIEIRDKVKNNSYIYAVFLQKYFEFMGKHKDEKVTSNSYTYVYVDVSYSLFFELLLTLNTSTLSSFNDQTREKFESECQITIDTFKERKQFVILGLDQFSKIVKTCPSPSDVPKHLVRFLFPEVNLHLWYLILKFKFAQDVNKSGIQSVIDLPFFKDTRDDYQSMQRYSSNTDYQQRMDERQKTCELAVYLFENEFSQELLDQYINEAQQQNDIKTKDYLIELFSCLKRVKHT